MLDEVMMSSARPLLLLELEVVVFESGKGSMASMGAAGLPLDRLEEERWTPCAFASAARLSILGGSVEAFFIEIDDRTLVSRRRCYF